MANAAVSRRLLGLPFLLPTRLAVGFGLEALPAFGRIHPGRGQAVVLVPPFLSAEDLAGKPPHNRRHHRVYKKAETSLAALSPSAFCFLLPEVVPRDGIEPPTRGFSVLCSTN